MGIAETVRYATFTGEELKEKLTKLLENGTYAHRVAEVSKAFRDQKESPMERAIWWIEWTMRNPNAEYMRSPVHKLGHVAANAFDVVAFFIALAAIVFYLIVKCTKMAIGTFSNAKKVNAIEANKKIN